MKHYIFHLKVEGHGETKEIAREEAKAGIGQSDLMPDEVDIFGERLATVIGWPTSSAPSTSLRANMTTWTPPAGIEKSSKQPAEREVP